MRAVVMHAAGDVRVEEVPDAALVEPTDAVIRVTSSCVCGSDLWPYRGAEPIRRPRRMGHEYVGVVEEVGPEVREVAVGDLVVGALGWDVVPATVERDGPHGPGSLQWFVDADFEPVTSWDHFAHLSGIEFMDEHTLLVTAMSGSFFHIEAVETDTFHGYQLVSTLGFDNTAPVMLPSPVTGQR